MSTKHEHLAEDLMRSYSYIRRFVGVRWDDEDGAWVLSRPAFDANVTDLARVVLGESPRRTDVASAIGAREVLHLSAGTLGKAWFHLGKLERRDTLRNLIADGVRPLRSLRGQDIDAVLEECRVAMEAAQREAAAADDARAVLALLFESDGERLYDAFLEAQRPDATASQLRDARLREFVDTAERVEAGHGPAQRGLRALWARLCKLPIDPAARARALVGALREHAGGSDPHQLGRRRTLEAAARGRPLVEAARVVCDLAAPREIAAAAEALSQRDEENLLALAITLRGTELELPRGGGERLTALLYVAERLALDRLEPLWPSLFKLPLPKLRAARWTVTQSALPGDVLARAIELDVQSELDEFEGTRGVRAYLDAVERLRANPVPNVSPTAEWFVAPFRSGNSWEPTLVLSLLATHRAEPETLVSTLEAARMSGIADFGFADAMAGWQQPLVEIRPPEWDTVGELLDLTVSQLERYVHWRRIAGYGESFSAAVRKPAELEEREARELAHLRTLPQNRGIAKRIASLESDDLRALRLASEAKRARNAFERALELLERESLESVLNETARAAFERLLGRKLVGRLPDRIRSLMLLVGAQNVDLDAVRGLLEDLLAGRKLEERDTNQRWLARLDAHGMNTARWLRGVDVTLNVAGTQITVTTEMDPLHVLEMGSYFDTCLSLDGGFNAASTLSNAIDVNKQVLYGRREDGTVVARKLIGVTDDGLLLGYNTYAFENQEIVASVLGRALATFAQECGLQLSTSGVPTALHDTFWYDDGVETWRTLMSERARGSLPGDIPPDDAATAEWAYVSGFDDPERWRWGATLEHPPWSGACAARAALHYGEGAVSLDSEARRQLGARASFDWIETSRDHPWTSLEAISHVLPAEEAAVRRLLDTLRRTGRRRADWGELNAVPLAVAALDSAQAAAFVIEYVRLARDVEVECLVDNHTDCLRAFIEQTADVLHASWVRGGPGDIDALFASKDPVVVEIAVELCSRVHAPSASRRLRSLFKQRGADGRIEWALARQGDEASLWALQSALGPDAEVLGGLSERQISIDRLFGAEFDAEAVQAAEKAGCTHRLGALAFALDDDGCALVVDALSVRQSGEHMINLRYLFERAPDASLLRVFNLHFEWEATQTLGPDPENWQRYLNALAGAGETQNAMWTAQWAAAWLDPPAFEEQIAALLDRHEAAFVRDFVTVMEVLTSGGQWEAGSYRLLEQFVRWCVPRLQSELPEHLASRYRGSWLIDRWGAAREWSGNFGPQ